MQKIQGGGGDHVNVRMCGAAEQATGIIWIQTPGFKVNCGGQTFVYIYVHARI